MEKFNFSYDKKNDDLFLYSSRSKSKGSVEIGDLILDFNRNKELVGLQMINASNLMKELVNESQSNLKTIFANLKTCKADIKSKNNLIIIKLHLASDFKEINPIIPVPVITKSSPALCI